MSGLPHQVRARLGRVIIFQTTWPLFPPYSPFFINDGANWLTLSPRQMREFSSMRHHCLTLGPPGVAQICKTVEAGYFLPYAHWWGQLGGIGDSAADQPGQEEESLKSELADCLRDVNAGAKIVPWRIGDGFLSRPEGGFEHAPI